MALSRKQVGALGEKLAGDYLEKRSYKILERNYRSADGELDIVARHGCYLVFVEVRTKTSLGFGHPEESITQAKMNKLKTMANHYLQSHENLPESWRIDVVAVELDEKGKPSRIELIENAVSE